jgi:uncharacterized protein YqeY
MITEKLDQDVKKAMLAKDAETLATLRFLKSAIKYAAIEKTTALIDTEIIQVIQKQIKQRRESIQQFTEGGRKDLVDKEGKEIAILERYLPKQLSDEELKEIVEKEARALGVSTKKDFGRLMKHLSDLLSGSADNRRLSAELGRILK